MTDKYSPKLLIGIDIGGTFTDFIVHRSDTGELKAFKLFSTPSNPAHAVNQGLATIFENELHGTRDESLDVVITHGSTVATNALLERNGARTALITTLGFGDVIEIGRQNRPSLYDFAVKPAKPLVPEDLRFEVSERIDHNGKVLVELNQDELPLVAAKLDENSGRRRVRPTPMSSSMSARTATRPSSAKKAFDCLPANGSGSPSPAPYSRIPIC